MFTPIFLVFHILLAIALVALILVQQGKGAEAGAAFGSGASNTMFGSTGSTNALTKLTAVLALLFFATSLAMAWHAQKETTSDAGIPKQEIIEEQHREVGLPLLDGATSEAPATQENQATQTTQEEQAPANSAGDANQSPKSE